LKTSERHEFVVLGSGDAFAGRRRGVFILWLVFRDKVTRNGILGEFPVMLLKLERAANAVTFSVNVVLRGR
jgi:hypothetical protein